MKQLFLLKAKPFSINSAFYRDGHIKTAENREWAAGIFQQLSRPEQQVKLQAIREAFDETKHSVKVSIKITYPKDKYITKQNILSSRTIDCSNFEKLIIDLFFDKQYFEEPFPNGCRNLNINDKHIISLYSSKKFHEQDYHLLELSVSIVKRQF